LQQFWFPFPGAIEKLNSSNMKFVELITTGDQTGAVPSDELRNAQGYRARVQLEDDDATHELYCLAAHITGEVKGRPAPDAVKPPNDADKAKGKSASDEAAKKRAAEATHGVNVVLVADIDLMANEVFQIESTGEQEEIGAHFDNVVFMLNALDVLAGDTKFVEIRKRAPAHRTLETIENLVAEYRKQRDVEQKESDDKITKEIRQAQASDEEFVTKYNDLAKKASELVRNGEDLTPELREELENATISKIFDAKRIENRVQDLKRDQMREEEILDRKLNSNIRHDENIYKFLAVALPPILPFIVGVFVFFSRRAQEREGVAKSRLR
jgi:ABC-2 type transport system permease protein